jgi:hypothetical protein
MRELPTNLIGTDRQSESEELDAKRKLSNCFGNLIAGRCTCVPKVQIGIAGALSLE